MRTDAEAHELIRLSTGAALVGVHSRTLRRWISQGRLTGWRLGSNQIRVSRAELLGLATPMEHQPSGDGTIVTTAAVVKR
ncbi:excisionase family DNA-binding protein [Nocardia fluminea]|uniref:excisionase family DNA-binding protein n=1 Tax=Nocardia fluminea TaxID=134984 RepID=UPI003792D4A0